ncbi:MAG: type II secretion system F family protein [Armatimonadetes bacterium]|nr:type II secretion system F family protein [Armatimonadota bacterium]
MLLVPLIVLVAAAGLMAVILALTGQKESDTTKPQQADKKRKSRDGSDRAPVLTRLLSAGGMDQSLQQLLLAAGLLVRPSELAAASIFGAATGFGAALLLWRSLTLAGFVGLCLLALPICLVNLRISKRRREFERRLPEALELMASALKSGYTFSRALQLVAKEMPGPMGDEAQRFTDELLVGVSVEEAIERLAERQPTYDVKLFAAAVQINSKVGGNLAEILLKTATVVRERFQIQSEIRALTAEGRLSAGILAAIPIFMAIVINGISPGYLAPLLTESLGRYMIMAGFLLWTSGLYMIKKLVTVEL